MSGIQVLMFGVDGLYDGLAPLYAEAEQKEIIDIAAYAVIRDKDIAFYRRYKDRKGEEPIPVDELSFYAAVLSTKENFIHYRKMLQELGIPKERIIDGRVFAIEGLDFSGVCEEGVARGILSSPWLNAASRVIYPQIIVRDDRQLIVTLGRKSYIENSLFNAVGYVDIGDFTSISSGVEFQSGINNGHDYHRVFSYEPEHWDGPPQAYFSPAGIGAFRMRIGSDVWIGAHSVLKATVPDRPLVIGDGAVIAANSVVVTDIPPYAVAGGNPARVIKYRFPEDIISGLQDIKWWEWPLEKINDNLPFFVDPIDFVNRFGEEPGAAEARNGKK